MDEGKANPPSQKTAYRSHAIGYITAFGDALMGQEVTLSGFAESVRGRGGICFLHLRDESGRIQAFLKRDNMEEAIFGEIQQLSRESTVQVTGTVSLKRPPKTPEGAPAPPPEYEIQVTTAQVLTVAETPLPLGVTDKVGVDLDTRLDSRYLDLRRKHVNAMFRLRGKVLEFAREGLVKEGFTEVHTPKIVATATEGGTNLFPMQYFETPAFLNQSPQLFKQLLMAGGMGRIFEVGPAFRAEKHDTYRHLNEFISFDIEMSWADDEDVMGVQERMLHHIHSKVAEECLDEFEAINEWRADQEPPLEPITPFIPELPFPRVSYDEAIEVIRAAGRDIEWGADIDAEDSDILAAKYPGYYFIPKWPMSIKPFYIHHVEGELSLMSGGQLSRGFDLNYGRDEMTSGGQREHRIEVLTANLVGMGLDPKEFKFYLDGFRHGIPPHGGWGLGVERVLMVITGAGNVRETVLFPRDRKRLVP